MDTAVEKESWRVMFVDVYWEVGSTQERSVLAARVVVEVVVVVAEVAEVVVLEQQAVVAIVERHVDVVA